MSNLRDPYFLLIAGKEFFENGTLYASKYFRLKDGNIIKQFDSTIHPKLCVPITNIAFSLELTFKGLLLHEGKNKKGHNLFNLYQLLDVDIKSRIIGHYKQHNTYKNLITIRLRDNDKTEHGKKEIFLYSESDEDFIHLLLKTHSSAFINFRYVHEFPANQE